MTIIIDGYNVLKTVLATSQVSEHQREHFITQLARYAHLSHNKISVVFDGGQDIRPTTYSRNGIAIVYSGYRDSADDVIKHLLEQKQHREVMLVSTDRELNRYAAVLDIPSIDSTVFYGYFQERLRGEQRREVQQVQQARTDARKRPGHESSAELDALMTGASEKVFHKHDDEQAQENQQYTHRDAVQKKSKEEKKLEKMVKKL